MNGFMLVTIVSVWWSGTYSECPRQPLSSTYRLISTLPANCDPSNCDYYLGIRTNDEDPQFLDFMMVGKAQGWIAVGFSSKPDMDDADVLACAVDPSTMRTVTVLDAYNIPDGHENVRDTVQDVCPHMTSFTDGRITCIFSRAINTGDPQDKDLNGDYYEQFAAVDNSAAIVAGNVTLTYHGSQTPLISKSTVNPASTNASVPSSSSSLRVTLTRVHGVLMVVAWPVLAVIGIFFAAWMKPVLPNGRWFQVHRAAMLLSLFTAAVGFLVIFVANKDYTIPGLIPLKKPLNIAHFVMGITVMFFHVANPIVAIFRCKPTAERRWIFNALHGTAIGFGVGVLALTNCGLGVALFEEIFAHIPGHHTILWLYVGFTSFLLVLVAAVLVLRVKEEDKVLSISLRSLRPVVWKYFAKDATAEMVTPLMEKDLSAAPSMTKVLLRCAVLTALLAVMVPMMVTMVTLLVIN